LSQRLSLCFFSRALFIACHCRRQWNRTRFARYVAINDDVDGSSISRSLKSRRLLPPLRLPQPQSLKPTLDLCVLLQPTT
jgi:hypothetical protein